MRIIRQMPHREGSITNGIRSPRAMLLSVVCVLLSFIAGAPARAQTIADTVFSPGNWSHSILLSSPTVSLGPMTQELADDCGGGDGYQQGRHTLDGSFAHLYDGHLFVGGGTYDPSTQGPITSLDVSYCLKNIVGIGIQDGLLLVQGTRTFVYFVDSAGPYSNWTPLGVTGITNVWNPAWVEISGNTIINFTTPDFSSSGAPITFGYYTYNQLPLQGGHIDNTWGIDNFVVTIHSTQLPTPTPAQTPGPFNAGKAKQYKTWMVRALTDCVAPTTTINGGLPACAPPIPISPYSYRDCVGWCQVQIDRKPKLNCNCKVRVRCRGILDPNGVLFSGSGFKLGMVWRETASAATGVLFPVTIPLNTFSGSIDHTTDCNAIWASAGLSPMPASSSVEIDDVAISDPDGKRFAVPGFNCCAN